MEWTELKQQTIKSVYYQDSKAGAGRYIDRLEVHYLPDGLVLLEMASGVWIRIENDIERNGLRGCLVDSAEIQEFHKINLNHDLVWSGISNRMIKNVKLYSGHYFLGQSNPKYSKRDLKKEITVTVELIFQHGESLFISNAELTSDAELEQSLFDRILYTKRKIGLAHGLISEQE